MLWNYENIQICWSRCKSVLCDELRSFDMIRIVFQIEKYENKIYGIDVFKFASEINPTWSTRNKKFDLLVALAVSY